MDKNQQWQSLNKRLTSKFRAKTLLFGKGSLNSAVMLVSEYPNSEEAKKNKPLMGSHGKAIDRFLKNTGFTRRNVYITNAVKAVKGKNELPDPKEIKQFSQFLREEIKIIEPKVIIALGGISLRGLNVKLPLFNIRGRIIRFGTETLFATHHPSETTKNPKLQEEIDKDLNKLQTEIKNHLA